MMGDTPRRLRRLQAIDAGQRAERQPEQSLQ